MIDFIGGVFFIDIMDDDLKIETTRNALVSDHQDWFKSYFKSIEVLNDKVKLTPDYSKTSINRMTDPIISINIKRSFKAK